MEQILCKSVAEGQVAGASLLVLRAGQTHFAAAGWRDIERKLPIERGTIFRIASMTKPITSVAALILVEEGRIALDEPIARVAPEFAKMRVLLRPDGPLDQTVEANRQITFDDLLTHRSGLTYGDPHRSPLSAAYRERLGGDIDSHVEPDEWIRRLAELPLVAQPGSAMYYGNSTDLLGLLVARIEGLHLGEVLLHRIFEPLGMTDTGFWVPPEKRERRASAYGFDEQGRLMKRATWGGVVVEERPKEMAYESGGVGLWSTLDDYLKFARLFLGDGAVDGVRLLRPATLRKMMTNQLTHEQRANSVFLGRKPFAVGRGFGLGVSVVLEQDESDMFRRGNPGTVTWPGAYGGWWEADPTDQSAFVFLAHNMADLAQMARGIGIGVWALIDDVQRAIAQS
ncbi:serine hydrolase domain-containing protein [Occallatibacter savannae]|uniref:serine hydrolase domain-containing protein n=1 Tax=Occallatibacter savannae TaxID=1002691 RepID=UPI00194E01C3|nr:serine hydrolase domain-containing protein [Occallatibacter savannae]